MTKAAWIQAALRRRSLWLAGSVSLLLVLFVFGLPDVGLRYSLFTSAVICLALYAASFVCETVRSGIRTVAVGQAEVAARALLEVVVDPNLPGLKSVARVASFKPLTPGEFLSSLES